MRALAVLSLMLAGCIGFGHCGYTPSVAYWEDPTLFDAMATDVVPPKGIDVGIPNVALNTIMFRNASREGAMIHDGQLMATDWNPQSLQGLGEDARRLLQNATDLTEPQIDDHVQRFLASGDTGHGEIAIDDEPRPIKQYSIPIDGDINGPGLLEHLGYNGTGREDTDVPGWRLHFTVAMKHMFFDDYKLSVDAFGVASMDHQWMELEEDAVVKADVRRVMEEQGLPIPDEMHVSGYIC